MIKLLIWGALAYFAFSLIKRIGFLSNSKDPTLKKKDTYKNLNIEDADYEDINNEGKV